MSASVAQVNVGFQVKLRELDEQMKKANNLFKESERRFKSVGSEFTKTGQVIAKVNQPLGDAVGRFGEMSSMVPVVGKEIAKLNVLIRANPWIALGTAIAAAGVALAAYLSKTSEAARIQKTISEVTIEANKNIVQEQVNIGILLRVARDDTRSKKERLEAIKAINEISPKYLGNITLEKINTEETIESVERYISALRDKAKHQAIEGKLVEFTRKKIELEMSKIGESGVVQQAFDKLWEVFGVKSDVVIRNKEDLENYIKTMNLSAETADKLREAYEPLLKNREKELGSIDSEIQKLEELAAASVNTANLIDDSKKKTQKPIIKEGTVKAFEYQIELLQKFQKEVATTAEEYHEAAVKIEEIQKKIDALTAKRDKLEAVKVVTAPKTGTKDYYDDLIAKVTKLRDAQEIGSLEWQRYNRQLEDIEIEIKAKMDDDSFKKAHESIGRLTEAYENSAKAQAMIEEHRIAQAKAYGEAVSGAFDVMASNFMASMNEGETALDRFGAAMMQTVMKLISMALQNAVSQAIVNATVSASSTGPGALFVQPVFIAEAVGGVLAAFASIPKFADGGVVYGPTLGLMGEYAGAMNNPEIIAPLNKLKELIEPTGLGNIDVSLGLGTKISGSDLQLIIERAVVKHLRTK